MGWSRLKGEGLKGKGSFRLGFKPRVCSFLASCILILGSVSRSSAQTFAEWWSQKKTQISYLEQQIAALQVYGKYVKQGYHISQDGLGSIGGWAKGEFELHTSRYTALRQVNPNIRDDGRAVAVVNDLNAISKQFSALQGLDGLRADDRKYISKVRAKVISECDADASELELVMTSGEAEMTDDERLARLGRTYERVKELLSFSSGFCSRVKALIMQREQAERDLKVGRSLYGVD